MRVAIAAIQVRPRAARAMRPPLLPRRVADLRRAARWPCRNKTSDGITSASKKNKARFFSLRIMTTVIRASSILRAKQEDGVTVESILLHNTKLPEKKEIEGQYKVSLLLHG